MNVPKIKILEAVTSRYVTTKTGAQKQVFAQKAQLETEAMRIVIEVEVDGPQAGYKVGETFDWDVTSDLVPGRFGPELARRMTLREPARVQAAKAA